MSSDQTRHEAQQMFFHGYDNYMKHAFPEDEIRPISCKPLTRDRANPAHVEVNDALGNYSLTLIDSLSTLAIMASEPRKRWAKNKALLKFQSGVEALVEQYGDGTAGANGVGLRARGFDLDSKVQVFETMIRGVGGLLSAHLFAVGELPIRGYNTKKTAKRKDTEPFSMRWSKKFVYNGQLLRLAEDLGKRLLPAFVTVTGIPYPRVNLRSGIPFYTNSPLNVDPDGQCPLKQESSTEVTETCSAGAGSLVLEFATLSRLTGNPIYEQVAKMAFWAVWDRRPSTGLVGAGIDAETGKWTSIFTGIGAGIDSFYEYAAKASVLLSGLPVPDDLPRPLYPGSADSSTIVGPYRQHASAYDQAWQISHAAIKKHLYRGHDYGHPHYLQADLFTGASRAYWVDSLSAFYPGLLAMFGKIREATEIHLLPTALWTRYSALPERWSVSSGAIEGGLGWWVGRPEFIESTYHLYQALKDPWYLHVGEMTLRDIKRRCWTKCGFAGLQNVQSGDKMDRMESFFLGETAKYLYLLFSPDHPLNKLDAPFVFTTEGHPLIIPRHTSAEVKHDTEEFYGDDGSSTCPAPPLLPFGLSATAVRGDLFHAAKLAHLDEMPAHGIVESALMEQSEHNPSITLADLRSPSNFTYYPWTLPPSLIPPDGLSMPLQMRKTFDLAIPAMANAPQGLQSLSRVSDGLYVNSMSGLRLNMVQDNTEQRSQEATYRIQSVNSILLGRDERIYLPRTTALAAVTPTDPNFSIIRDTVMLDLAIDHPPPQSQGNHSESFNAPSETISASAAHPTPKPSVIIDPSSSDPAISSFQNAISVLLQSIGLLLSLDPSSVAPTTEPTPSSSPRTFIPPILPVGPGSAPLPDIEDVAPPDVHGNPQGTLPYNTIFAADEACKPLPASVPRNHEILILKRGRCSFSQKLANIPLYAPSRSSLQLVIIVSYQESKTTSPDQASDSPPNGSTRKGRAKKQAEPPTPPTLTRPALEVEQHSNSGMRRRHPIPLVMVDGGEDVYQMLKKAKAVGFKRRYEVQTQGTRVQNLYIL